METTYLLGNHRASMPSASCAVRVKVVPTTYILHSTYGDSCSSPEWDSPAGYGQNCKVHCPEQNMAELRGQEHVVRSRDMGDMGPARSRYDVEMLVGVSCVSLKGEFGRTRLACLSRMLQLDDAGPRSGQRYLHTR